MCVRVCVFGGGGRGTRVSEFFLQRIPIQKYIYFFLFRGGGGGAGVGWGGAGATVGDFLSGGD